MKKIENYIKNKLKNPIAAQKFVKNIENSIYQLSYFPYIGAQYKNSTYYRFLVHQNYLIFYEIQEKEKQIIVKRIIHKNVNIENIDFYLL